MSCKAESTAFLLCINPSLENFSSPPFLGNPSLCPSTTGVRGTPSFYSPLILQTTSFLFAFFPQCALGKHNPGSCWDGVGTQDKGDTWITELSSQCTQHPYTGFASGETLEFFTGAPHKWLRGAGVLLEERTGNNCGSKISARSLVGANE